jgi:predicted metalloendopeptidase
MSKETKEQATIKLNSIGRKLGFPSKWEDFSILNFSKENYIENTKEMNRFACKKNLSELYKKVDKEKWEMPAHKINAYYHPLLNEIAFPAGIMQPPFFDENSEDAVNYGSIGTVIGHEFTHGFDDMGSKFGADGSFKNWWTDTDLKLFEERTALLGETFAGFCPIEGHCVNPDLTMGENIADLCGGTIAFNSLKKANKNLTLEDKKLFFISYAKLWRQKMRSKELSHLIKTDVHSPGILRVNEVLKNMDDFYETFDITKNDKMYIKLENRVKIF